jgi:hypothetical protein
MSLIASAPSAIATARLTSTRPGSCLGRRPRTPCSAVDSSAVRMLASARSASSRVPACDTTPGPVRGHGDLRSGRCSLNLESASPPGRSEPSASSVSLVKRHFRLSRRQTRRPAHEELPGPVMGQVGGRCSRPGPLAAATSTGSTTAAYTAPPRTYRPPSWKQRTTVTTPTSPRPDTQHPHSPDTPGRFSGRWAVEVVPARTRRGWPRWARRARCRCAAARLRGRSRGGGRRRSR